MNAVYLGYQCPGTDTRKERVGFTIGRVYAVTHAYNSIICLDDDGVARCRPPGDFEVQTSVCRAWARFPSLQEVFA